ncbi:Alanine--tRNA ligase [Alphaproteobacteria bacterium]
MKINQIRKFFLDFFAKHQHKVLESGPLIPHNDPSLMFANSGMVQFKNCFTGTENPEYTRVATAQKCVRAGGKHNDLENVGYTTRHHTFFEMLGNFSFGDYFKELAIELAWNLLTKEFKIPKDRLYITVYHEDDDAFKIWQKITGYDSNKIIKISTSDNFWSMGDIGPCGPCSEIFYDHGDQYAGGLPGTPQADGDRYVEIWNLVFMQYEKLKDGSIIKLPKPSIDTGMGLERIATVLQGVADNFQIDLFQHLIAISKELSGNDTELTSHKIIADHLRASSFLIADGVLPSNEGRGYVLRRIMRRAMRHIHCIGCKEPLLYRLVPSLLDEMGEAYPELKRAENIIISTLKSEEEKFRETLERGLKLLNSSVEYLKAGEVLDGNVAFKLYDTYGFPLDLTVDILKTRNIGVDQQAFEQAMYKQRQRARAAWTGSGEKVEDKVWFDIYEEAGATEFLGYTILKSEAYVAAIVSNNVQVHELKEGNKGIIILNQTSFYGESGGQIGDRGALVIGDVSHKVENTIIYAHKVFGHHVLAQHTIKIGDKVIAEIDTAARNKIRSNHSATHLLHYVLRNNLGCHVMQKGSLVNEEKLRFDFSHTQALTDEELRLIEQEVNKMIIENIEGHTSVMSYKQALSEGVMALFGEKYGDEVRVVNIDKSVELCGGTHAKRTGDIGMFKIIKEEAISAGIRRIEAVTRMSALNFCNAKCQIVKNIASSLKCHEEDVFLRVEKIIDEKKLAEKTLIETRVKLCALDSNYEAFDLVGHEIGAKIKLIALRCCDIGVKDLKQVASTIRNKYQTDFVTACILTQENGLFLLVHVAKNLLELGLSANNIITQVISKMGGKGGGNAEMAQVGNIPCTDTHLLIGIIKNVLSGTKLFSQ